MDRDVQDPLGGSEPADPEAPGTEPGAPDPTGVEPGPGVGPAAGPGDPESEDGPDRWFLDGYADLVDEAPPRPPVVAVVVVRDPGDWLEEALGALVALDYADLSVLVIDDGSTEDPTPRIAAVAPSAFVRRRPEPDGFAVAANEVIATVEGATFLLFTHGDAVLDPDALGVMVDEGVRSNAGIVGPKVVRAEDPTQLLEVGMTVDRLGAPHGVIEPGEIDQEQHDAVRDVFWVSGVAMLVRSSMFAEIGGFDPGAAPGAEDIDLAWRARIAGARVMVAPDARVLHHGADGLRDVLDAPPAEVEAARHRAMLTSASVASLMGSVPVAVLLGLLEALLALISGHRRRAAAILGGWWIALRGIPAGRAARRAAQSHRRVHDGDLRYLQSRGSSRVKRFMNGTLHADDRLREFSARGRTLTGTAGARVREPVGIAVLVFVALVAIGSRGLILGSVPQIGQMRVWPSVGAGWTTFTSAWRDSLLGAGTQQPPLLLVTSGLGSLLLGATGLARTLLIVAAMPLGVIAAWRLGRAVAGPGLAAVVTGIAYGVLPLPRNAIAAGRFGPLLAYALAPVLVLGLARAGGLLEGAARPRRLLVALAAGVALVAVWWPPALVLPFAVAVAFTVAAPYCRDASGSRAWGPAARVSAGAVLLLLPWPIVLLGLHDGGTLGLAYSGSARAVDLLRFHTGPAGAGIAGWLLLGVAFVVLLLASGPRFAWAVRAWGLILVGFGLAWLPARFAPGLPVPVREGLLVPAAVGLALAVGLGAAALLTDIGRRGFGWRQIAAVLATAALVVPVLAFAADAVGGRWRTPGSSWVDELHWMSSRTAAGEFRVLWLGDASVLPLDPARRGTVAFGTTTDGTGDARVLVPVPDRGAQRRVGDAVEQIRDSSTRRIGSVLGPLGVRYLAVPDRVGPTSGRIVPAPDGIVDTLADQLDLVRLETRDGLALYEVVPWQPVRSVVARTPGGLRTPPLGPRNPAGEVQLLAPRDPGWRARGADGGLARIGSDPAHNAWRLPEPGPVSLGYAPQWTRWFAVLLQFGVLVLAVRTWRSDRPRRARHGGAGTALPDPDGVAPATVVTP